MNDGKIPRVRHAKDIDFSKADPKCETCKGTGISGTHEYTENKKGFRPHTETVPVVCECVRLNGGIAPDGLDRLMSGESPLVVDRQAREKALAGGDVAVLDLQQRGGYNVTDGTWVCQQCLTVIKRQLPAGPVTLPPGWRIVFGRVVCSDECEKNQQAQALVDAVAREVSIENG